MKKYIFVITAALFVLISCENTNENLVQERGKAVNVGMSEAVPAFFIGGDVESSYVAFDLELAEEDNIDNAELEVVYGDKKAILRSIDIPSTDMKVTAAEIVQALGISPDAIKVGDVFYLYVLTTREGMTTRSTAALTINVTCEFDASLTTGNYKVESADWEMSGNVTLEADPNDPNKIYISGYAEQEGLVSNGNRIELNINPNSFNITGPSVVIANEAFGYTNYTYQPLSGSYSSCDGTYTVVFDISVIYQGSPAGWGPNTFVFTRQ